MAKETFNLATRLEDIEIRLEAIRAAATLGQYACEDTGGDLPPHKSLMQFFFLLDGDLGEVIDQLEGCMQEALHMKEGGGMNGYKAQADIYRKYLDDPEADTEAVKDKIVALDVLGDLKARQRMELFNTGVFNAICKGYTMMALDRAGVDREPVLAQLCRLLDEVVAIEAQRYCLKEGAT